MDWETNGHYLGYIPFDLHGNHNPMVHHYMLKDAHTISYIQQANHKWIKGEEEETTYTQATKSLKLVPMDIQHGPEVLQKFKAAHKPLVKALFSFENMESHGKPIKPVICQLITRTPPKEGITLSKFFGGIGTGLKALL